MLERSLVGWRGGSPHAAADGFLLSARVSPWVQSWRNLSQVGGKAAPNPNVAIRMATLGFTSDQVRGSPPTRANSLHALILAPDPDDISLLFVVHNAPLLVPITTDDNLAQRHS